VQQNWLKGDFWMVKGWGQAGSLAKYIYMGTKRAFHFILFW
jgi:hypothetical protein